MKKVDMISAVVLLCLAGYIIWEAGQMPPSATFGPGPGFFPFWVGAIMAALASVLLGKAWLRQAATDEKPPFPRNRRAILSIGAVLAGLAIYIELLEPLGFLTDTFLYVTFLLAVVQREKWGRALVVSVLTTGGLYTVFQVLLGITLPSNMLGF